MKKMSHAHVAPEGAKPEFFGMQPWSANFSLADLHDQATSFAKVNFAQFGQLPPVWLFLAPNRSEVAIYATPFGSPAEKHATVDWVRGVLGASAIPSYAHIAECWIGERQDGVARRDGVTITTVDLTGKAFLTTYEIVAAKKGRKQLRRLEHSGEMPVELGAGYLWNLFGERDKPPAH